MTKWVKIMFVDMSPVGSLQIFGVCSEEEASDPNCNLAGKIYWTDALAITPQGLDNGKGFGSIYEATKAHVDIVKCRRQYKEYYKECYGNTPDFPQTNATVSFIPPKAAVPLKDNITNIADWKAKRRKVW